jgi:hypothetical protein
MRKEQTRRNIFMWTGVWLGKGSHGSKHLSLKRSLTFNYKILECNSRPRRKARKINHQNMNVLHNKRNFYTSLMDLKISTLGLKL